MHRIAKSRLFAEVISEENIFSAIYSLESYLFEINLLDREDLNRFYELKDKYNKDLIQEVITQCKEKLQKVLTTNEYFNIKVFFKAKRYNKEDDKIEYRPMKS